MKNEKIDTTKRGFLRIAASFVGFIGAIGATIPFTKYFLPSAKAKSVGGPIEVDISDLEPGRMKTVQWQGRPIMILRRTPQMLEELEGLEDRLRDAESNESIQPMSAKNPHRSINPEYVILEGVCTHLGCVPMLKPEHGFSKVGDWYRGGFFCPCHKSGYDMAGRIYKGMPAPANLRVPPHRYITKGKIMLGEDVVGA